MNVAEAEKNFAKLVDRVYAEGISVDLERDNKVIARLTPAEPSSPLTVAQLNAFLRKLPPLGDDADAFPQPAPKGGSGGQRVPHAEVKGGARKQRAPGEPLGRRCQQRRNDPQRHGKQQSRCGQPILRRC